jgi:hypothetical protein
MIVRYFRAASLAVAGLAVLVGTASAQPAAKPCTASFVLSDNVGSFASADIKDAGLQSLYVEMGPTHAAMTTTGPGVSGNYTATTPGLKIWVYQSIYQPAKEWLTPGSVRLDYSGFRVGWPEFSKGGKVVKHLKLTVTQGTQSMTVDVGASGAAPPARDHVFAIDFEAMLAGRYPTLRVGDHAAWRRVMKRPISVTLVDASNGKVIARGEAPLVDEATLPTLLSGGVNALRDKFKADGCG